MQRNSKVACVGISKIGKLAVLFLASIFLLGAAATQAKVISVRKEATGTGTGTSWTNAFTDPHQALAAALPGDEIWIAKGTYHPGAPGDILQSFDMPSGVRMYGGFAGVETNKSARNWKVNQTILSGDVGDDDTFGNPWWNGWNIGTPNSKHVITLTATGPGTVIDGIVVASGYSVQTSGGGILAEGSQFSVRNCVFKHNGGYQGYGTCLFVNDGFAEVVNCDFSENWGRFVNGVGIGTYGVAGAFVDLCRFYDNHAEADAALGNGAGIMFQGTLPSIVSRSEFSSNIALPFITSPYVCYGGGICNLFAPLEVDRCVFDNNEGVMGGGIFSFADLVVSNSKFTNNDAYSAINGGGFGGAVGSYFYNNYLLQVTGCTIVNNRGHETGGVWYGGSGAYTTDISTCIFWGNSDINGIVSQSSVKKASYSCIQNLWVTIPGEDPIDPEKFPNCIDSNPQFVQNYANLRLKNTSPCIDAGDKTAFDPTWKRDLASMPRYINVTSVPDTGFGTPPLPDMGCYEFQVRRH